jgi:hypothetical protein
MHAMSVPNKEENLPMGKRLRACLIGCAAYNASVCLLDRRDKAMQRNKRGHKCPEDHVFSL